MPLRRAQKSKSKLRIGLAGPSGAGKTYSALLLASGLAPWEKVVVIDTENTSADLYANLGQYNVLTLEAPYSPERFVEAIKECEKEGMEVIIVDSVTHEWEGSGGCLEINDKIAQAKFRGNTWSAWSQTTPRHQKFVEAITTSTAHIIACNRSKTETVQTDDKRIKKVGTKDIQREGFEYELTVKFDLDRDKHFAVASKDRTSMFIDIDPFIISAETGKQLLAWANDGVDSDLLVDQIKKLMEVKGKTDKPILLAFKVSSLNQLSMQNLMSLKNRLEKMPDAKKEEVVAPKEPPKAMPEPEPTPEPIVEPEPEEQEPLATSGDLIMISKLLERRGNGKTDQVEVLRSKLLDKFKKKELSELTRSECKYCIDMLSASERVSDKKLEEDAREALGV